jgi:tripartite-type tricarboxylate transporter receptor subunit TctC
VLAFRSVVVAAGKAVARALGIFATDPGEDLMLNEKAGGSAATRRRRAFKRRAIAAAILLPWLARAAVADPVEEFYRNRSISLVIGYSVGGGYDLYARTLARHMGKHIPGQPKLVPQNMEGAGGLRAANFLYGVAPKDGTTLGTFARGLATEPLLGNAKYDGTRFTWLGSITNDISLCASWYTSPVKTWSDLLSKPLTLGGSAVGADTDVFALVLRNVFGAKINLVSGYPGGNEINLAMERAEVEGRCGWSWSSIKNQKAAWLQEKKINLLVQFALEKVADLPDVPLVVDLANTIEQRQILRLILARQVMARPFLAPPDVPEDRKQALRRAFDATMKDADFLAEAAKADLEVNPIDGVKIDELLADLYQTPTDIVAKARRATEN